MTGIGGDLELHPLRTILADLAIRTGRQADDETRAFSSFSGGSSFITALAAHPPPFAVLWSASPPCPPTRCLASSTRHALAAQMLVAGIDAGEPLFGLIAKAGRSSTWILCFLAAARRANRRSSTLSRSSSPLGQRLARLLKRRYRLIELDPKAIQGRSRRLQHLARASTTRSIARVRLAKTPGKTAISGNRAVPSPHRSPERSSHGSSTCALVSASRSSSSARPQLIELGSGYAANSRRRQPPSRPLPRAPHNASSASRQSRVSLLHLDEIARKLAISIHQPPLSRGVQQPLLVMLAVDFDQMLAETLQGARCRRAGR